MLEAEKETGDEAGDEAGARNWSQQSSFELELGAGARRWS